MTSILSIVLLAALAGQAETEVDHEKSARTLVKQFRDGEFEQATKPFDGPMLEALPAGKLKQIWDGIVAQQGKVERLGDSNTEQEGPYQIVLVTVHFERGLLDAKVVFNKENKISGLFFLPSGKYQVPTYVDPERFEETEVTVGGGLFSLPGTLTLPKGEGPFPAVVLVHGSGPQDRDETIGPNKVFRDLAQGLATKGIAAVRYEKRTKHHKIQMALMATSITVKTETVDDAAAAVDLLAKHEKIDPDRVFICGHSLGGYLIPRMAKASERAAGFISLAGSARGLEVLIVEQTKYQSELDGKVTEEEQTSIEEVSKLKEKIDKLKPGAGLFETLGGAPAAYWLDLKGYQPAEEAKEITRPMFFLQGNRDFQVTATDFGLWQAALKGKPHVSFKEYPKLNHLFMAGEGNSSVYEYMTPSNVAEEVVGDIAAWIKERK